jgi:DNA-binding MarR family transcriptional regulator
MSENPIHSSVSHAGKEVAPEIDRLEALLAAVPGDLALPQLRALVAIAAEPGISVNELAQRIDVPQQSASRYVSVLLGRYQDPMAGPQTRILVEQRISEEDPRRRALFLTLEGTTLLTNIVYAAFGGLQQ